MQYITLLPTRAGTQMNPQTQICFFCMVSLPLGRIVWKNQLGIHEWIKWKKQITMRKMYMLKHTHILKIIISTKGVLISPKSGLQFYGSMQTALIYSMVRRRPCIHPATISGFGLPTKRFFFPLIFSAQACYPNPV